MPPTISRPGSFAWTTAWKAGRPGCLARALLGQAGRGAHTHGAAGPARPGTCSSPAIVPRFCESGVAESRSVRRIQSTPKPEYKNQATRKNRDGRDRCHSRHKTGLPSSDGPGNSGSQRGQWNRGQSAGSIAARAWPPLSPPALRTTPRIRAVASQQQSRDREARPQESQVKSPAHLAGVRVGGVSEVIRIREQ